MPIRKYNIMQLGGLYDRASFANSQFVPQFVGSNYEELKDLGQTLQDRYLQNRSVVDQVEMALAQDTFAQNDEHLRKELSTKLRSQIDDIVSSDKNFENSTAKVSQIVKDYVTNEGRLKAIDNYKRIEEFKKMQTQLGASQVNFGDDPNTFTSYDPETQNYRTFRNELQRREDTASKMQQLLGRVAVDGFYTDAKGEQVQVTPDIKATLIAWQKGEKVSPNKIKDVVEQLLPSYLNTVEGKQDLRILQELEPPRDLEGNPINPIDDIRSRFVGIGAPQIFSNVDIRRSIVDTDKPKASTPFTPSQPVFRPSEAVKTPNFPNGLYKDDYGKPFLGMGDNAAQMDFRVQGMDNILSKYGYKINSDETDIQKRYTKDGKAAIVFNTTTPEGKELQKLNADIQKFGKDFGFVQFNRDNKGILETLYSNIDPNLEIGLMNSDGTLNEEKFFRLPEGQKEQIKKTYEMLGNQIVTNLSAYSYPTLVITDKEKRQDIEEGLGLSPDQRNQMGFGQLENLRFYDLDNPKGEAFNINELTKGMDNEEKLELKKLISFQGITVPSDGDKSYGYKFDIGGKKYFVEETSPDAKIATAKIQPLFKAAADPNYDNNRPLSVPLSDLGLNINAPVYAYGSFYDNVIYERDLENNGIVFDDDPNTKQKKLRPRSSGIFIGQRETDQGVVSPMQQIQMIQQASNVYPDFIPVVRDDDNALLGYIIPFNSYLKVWEMLNNPARVKEKRDNE